MKKNNFFIVVLCNALVLLGISFEARGMENKNLMIGAGLGAAALITTLIIKKTATYQTYEQNKNRQLKEKEESENPFLYAQPISNNIELKQEVKPVEDRIAAFQQQYDQKRIASLQQTKKNDLYWDQVKMNDSYEPNKK